jgi:hypothetical protein
VRPSKSSRSACVTSRLIQLPAPRRSDTCARGADQGSLRSVIGSRARRAAADYAVGPLTTLWPQPGHRSPSSGPVCGRTRSGNPDRVRSALRKATISATRPSSRVRTSRPPECTPRRRRPTGRCQRDLAVGPGGQEPPAPLQRVAEQEGADLVLAAVPHGQRRHRVARVVGEHRDDRVDVAGLPGVNPAREDVIDGRVPQVAQHRLLGRRGRGDRLACPLQRAVDRGGRRIKLLGHLGRGEAGHIAQDQRRPLQRGQVLQRRGERELDALAGQVVRLGRDAGVGLEPADFGRGVPGVTPMGSSRRWRCSIAVRHQLVAIL